jgi:hypothetical protein
MLFTPAAGVLDTAAYRQSVYIVVRYLGILSPSFLFFLGSIKVSDRKMDLQWDSKG